MHKRKNPPSGRFTRPLNFHDLTSLDTIVPCDGVRDHDTWQLRLLQTATQGLSTASRVGTAALKREKGTDYFLIKAIFSSVVMIECLGTRKCLVMLTSKSDSENSSRPYSVDISCRVWNT